MRPLFFIAILFIVFSASFAVYMEYDTKRFAESLGTSPIVGSPTKNIMRVHPITIDPNTPRLKDIGGEEYQPPPREPEDQHKAGTTAEVPSESERAVGLPAPKPSMNAEILPDPPKSPITEKNASPQKTPNPQEMSPEEKRARRILEHLQQRSPDMIIPIEELLKDPAIASKLRGIPRGNAHVYFHRTPGEQREIREAVRTLDK